MTSIKRSETGISSNERISRSSSLTSFKFISDPGIKNIGSLDNLGNFCLDPEIRTNLESKNLSYWERIKNGLFEATDKEVKDEAKKIIQEVFKEVVKFMPVEDHPDHIRTFLNEL